MLEIEDGIALVVPAIGRRGVDEGLLEHIGALGPEEDLLDVSVRDVALLIECAVVCRDLDTALLTGGAVEVLSAGVIEGTAVDEDVIIVEALVHRTGSGAPPCSILTLGKYGAALAAKAEAYANRLCVRSFDAEAGIAL